MGGHPIICATSRHPDPSRLDDAELAHEFLEITRRIGCTGAHSNEPGRLGHGCHDAFGSYACGASSIFAGKS